jgi:hypothetical protein
MLAKKERFQKLIDLLVFTQPLDDKMIGIGIGVERDIRETFEPNCMNRVEVSRGVILDSRMRTEDDMDRTSIIKVPPESDQIVIPGFGAVGSKRPHHREESSITVSNCFLMIEVREGTEGDNSVSFEEHPEQQRGVSSHRLTDGPDPARANRTDEATECRRDLIHMTTQAGDAPVIPGILDVPDQDPVQFEIGAALKLLASPEEIEVRHFLPFGKAEADEERTVGLDLIDQASDLRIPASVLDGVIGQFWRIQNPSDADREVLHLTTRKFTRHPFEPAGTPTQT